MVKWSKTSPFHGGNPSSNLGRVTKKRSHSCENVFFTPTEVAHFQCARALHGELGTPD